MNWNMCNFGVFLLPLDSIFEVAVPENMTWLFMRKIPRFLRRTKISAILAYFCLNLVAMATHLALLKFYRVTRCRPNSMGHMSSSSNSVLSITSSRLPMNAIPIVSPTWISWSNTMSEIHVCHLCHHGTRRRNWWGRAGWNQDQSHGVWRTITVSSWGTGQTQVYHARDFGRFLGQARKDHPRCDHIELLPNTQPELTSGYATGASSAPLPFCF